MMGADDSWHQLLDREAAVCYVLDERLRITYCNPAWDRFALDNGGAGLERERWLGRSILEGVSPILRNFYSDAYRRVMEGNAIWNHSYQCSSSELHRTCEMVVYPLHDVRGLAVANFVHAEQTLGPEHPGPKRAMSTYRHAEGHVVMCANCRLTRRAGRASRWDWVPEFLKHPPEPVSHGLCQLCLQHYSTTLPTPKSNRTPPPIDR
jgi:hypothetical protein